MKRSRTCFNYLGSSLISKEAPKEKQSHKLVHHAAYSETLGAFSTPRLIFQDVNDNSRRFEIELHGRVLVGRDKYQCHIILRTDSTVARKQCELYLQDGQIMLHNLSTTNITMVNDHPVHEDCPLDSGSVITMGRVKLRMEVLL